MKRLLIAFVMFLASSFALAAVNINTATKEELDALPGIGPAKAQAIVDYRKANGPFKSPQDVMKVPGIKEAEFGKIRDQISVSGATTPDKAKQSQAARPMEKVEKSARANAEKMAKGAAHKDKSSATPSSNRKQEEKAKQ
jgi:competence protein ComEA